MYSCRPSSILLVLFTGTLVHSVVLDSCELSNSISLSGESSHGIVITSPNYPQYYPNSLFVCWVVTSQTDSVVTLVVQTYNTEIAYDHLDIYDGPSSSQNHLERLSGSGSNVTLLTSGSSMYIAFNADDSVNYNGFKACVCASGIAACVCDWSDFDSSYYDQDDRNGDSKPDIPMAAYYSIGFVAFVAFMSIFLGIRYGLFNAHRRESNRRAARGLLGNNNRVNPSPSVAIIPTPQAPPSYEASHSCPHPAAQPGSAPLDPPPAYTGPQPPKIRTSRTSTRVQPVPPQTELNHNTDPNTQTDLYPTRSADPSQPTDLYTDRSADPIEPTLPAHSPPSYEVAVST